MRYIVLEKRNLVKKKCNTLLYIFHKSNFIKRLKFRSQSPSWHRTRWYLTLKKKEVASSSFLFLLTAGEPGIVRRPPIRLAGKTMRRHYTTSQCPELGGIVDGLWIFLTQCRQQQWQQQLALTCQYRVHPSWKAIWSLSCDSNTHTWGSNRHPPLA